MSRRDWNFIFSSGASSNMAIHSYGTTNTTNTTASTTLAPSRYERFLALVMEYLEEGYEIDIVTGGVIDA